MIVHPREFEKALCEAIGVDPSVTRSILISVRVGTMPTVRVTQFVDEGAAEGLTEVVRRFDFATIPDA